jgi:hypothetical protein
LLHTKVKVEEPYKAKIISHVSIAKNTATQELIADILPAVFVAVPIMLPQNAPNHVTHPPNVYYAQGTIWPIIVDAPSIRNYNIENQLIQKVNFYMIL